MVCHSNLTALFKNLWSIMQMKQVVNTTASSPDFDHGQAWFEEAADMLADLSVGLGCLPEVAPHLLVGFIQHPLLLVGRTPRRAPAGRQQQASLKKMDDNGAVNKHPSPRQAVK